MTREPTSSWSCARSRETAVDNEKYFGDLDAVVGDGDFGYSLARGFESVLEGWDDIDRDRRRHVPEEGRDRHHRPHRRHLRADLGHRVPARGRRARTASPNGRRRRDRHAARGRSRASRSGAAPTWATRRCSTRWSRRSTRSRRSSPAARRAGAALRRRGGGRPRERPTRRKGMLAQRGRAGYTGERSTAVVDAGAVGVAVMFEAVSRSWSGASA